MVVLLRFVLPSVSEPPRHKCQILTNAAALPIFGLAGVLSDVELP